MFHSALALDLYLNYGTYEDSQNPLVLSIMRFYNVVLDSSAYLHAFLFKVTEQKLEK
jgi:hypothetical protein